MENAARALTLLVSPETELKIPIRIPATGLTDMEENTKPTKSDLAGAENGPCCACQKTPEEKDREKDDRVFFKIFENFLHNAIFLPRYSKPQWRYNITLTVISCPVSPLILHRAELLPHGAK